MPPYSANDAVADAMESLCRAHKRLDEAVRYRDQPSLRATVLKDVAGLLRATAGNLEGDVHLSLPAPHGDGHGFGSSEPV